jgi:hypothetical protein
MQKQLLEMDREDVLVVGDEQSAEDAHPTMHVTLYTRDASDL